MTGARAVGASCAALRECATQFWLSKTGIAAARSGLSLYSMLSGMRVQLVYVGHASVPKPLLRTLIGGCRPKTAPEGWCGAKITRRSAQFGTAAFVGGLGYYLWVMSGACGDVQRLHCASPPLPLSSSLTNSIQYDAYSDDHRCLIFQVSEKTSTLTFCSVVAHSTFAKNANKRSR